MKIDYSKTSKVSFLLSTMLLGAVSLSAVPVYDNQTVEINNQTSYGFIYLTNNSKLINNGIYDNRLDVEESEDSSVINNGTLNITNDWTAINAKKINKSSIINSGNINIIGGDSSNYVDINGIDVLNLVNSRVENKGNIISNLNSDATVNGIVVRDAQGSSIKNTGTINLKATGDDLYLQGIHLDGYFASQNSTSANFNNSEIINDKDILVSSKGKLVSSYGITSYDFNINDSQILNNGTISVSSEGVYADSAGMELDSLNNSQIINKGTIKADSTVTNNSDNENFADSFGISIDYLNNSKIENNGSILVNSSNIKKDNALSEAISVENFNNSTFENSGIIKSTINNKLDKNASAILYLNSSNSTISNEGTGKIYGNIVLKGDTTFNNKGFISLPYNANKNAYFIFNDNGIDETISLRPSFGNFTNSGTIEIGAFKNSNSKIENTQILTKNATFEKGSKMQVDVVAGSKAFVKGDTLSEVVTATDKLTINDLTLNQTKLKDNSALLDFEYKQTGNQLDIVVSDVKKLSDIVDGNTGNNTNTANKKPIASFFDDLRNNQSSFPNMGTILSKLDALSADNQVVAQALNSMIPTTAASVVNSSNTITSNIANIVSNRLGNLKSGLNSGDDLKVNNNRVWAKAFGSIGEQKDKDSISGFDIKSYGLGLGFDNEYKDGQVLGLATFYTNANIETNGVNHENDVDAYSVVAYGSNLLADDKTTIYYQGSHTWQKNDSKRAIFTGDVADSKFTSKTFALDLKVGHNIAINDSFSIEPNIGTTYRHISNPSYTENGAGALNIHSDKFTSSELLGNFGADFEYKINSDSKLTATIGAGYDFKNDNNIVTSSFAGAPGVSFDTNGIDNGRWQYQAGLGYDLNLDNKNNMNFSYKYQGEGSKYNNNVVSLDYIYKF